jgi:low affinity Fe/Cu permease
VTDTTLNARQDWPSRPRMNDRFNVIQNSANRDAKAVHLKLDELIRSVEGARNAFITLERAPEDTVAKKAAELAQIADEDDDPPLEGTPAAGSSRP